MSVRKPLLLLLIVPFIMGGAMSKPCDPNKKINIYSIDSDSVNEVFMFCKTDQEWKSLLTEQQYKIMRKKGTEAAFSVKCPLPPKGEVVSISVLHAEQTYSIMKINLNPELAGQVFGSRFLSLILFLKVIKAWIWIGQRCFVPAAGLT